MSETGIKFTVSEFIAVVNQTLDYAYPQVTLEGEVASFKINQNKWVFFDLKDETASLGCFMPLFQLRQPITDGMKVILVGTPKLTNWGKFSFTVQRIMPVGEGSIKKSFELLKTKLEKEGLFDPAKKRPLPPDLASVGVISSTAAAGYADFIKIINERWGGLKIKVAHTGVQGLSAADQITRAIKYFNEQREVQIIAIIRGGGSADDLAVFNDEQLVRTIASSRIPIITGIGHEVDESLCDLAADLRGSTPSNVAQMLVPDRQAEIIHLTNNIRRLKAYLLNQIDLAINELTRLAADSQRQILSLITTTLAEISQTRQTLSALNPERILKQGYAILSGRISPGSVVKITTQRQIIKAEVQDVQARN